jgi:hypothetical protein
MMMTLTRQAEAALNALRRHLAQLPRTAAPVITDGHEAGWRAQELERIERERAQFQLRSLGWPSA